ncbi:ATP-dependent 6-phosphofructokinase [Nitrospirillum sp. BR 11828]|uniref:ATP-dependent 6-phosphofructokinase n=1 Tax=Nitrospirillum sp. BR 11828 TaxID=3104325 RepID=UPI002ACA6CE8|nr:ATP-dependent 6-phosphofructokinase [Nitrospirillum sp. BR 11828]MDZ5647492.1 ATP-dependent 6-phosphofructokinase [Nitrospirillum sp. BR 11828]
MSNGKRIGILTSGGDCAGLNAVIRAVVHRAVTTYNWQVVGIEEGTHGLLDRPVRHRVLLPADVDGTMLRQGGTVLGTTNKGDPFAYPMPDGSKKDRSQEIISGCRELGLDALIGIGGDGSLAILRRLAQEGGLNLVGIPKTIDNDLGLTEVSVGYDTAVAVATEALDRLQPTAASHARVMVLEVMGRDAGHIALAAGIAGGADVILLPEIPWTVEGVANRIRQIRAHGRNFALVVVSEAATLPGGGKARQEFSDGQKRYGGIGGYIGHLIAEATGAETRVTVLGHVQRGGSPNPRDRLIASAFGVHAVDLIAQGRYDRMVAWSNRKVIDVPIADAIKAYAAVDVDGTLVRTARGLGIYVGEPMGDPVA